MHLAVIDIHPDVTCKGTGERAFAHLVVDTLEYGRHKAGIDGTSDHAVDEFQFTAPRKVEGFLTFNVEYQVLAVNLELVGHRLALNYRADEKVHFSELACTAGLFLVTVVCS